MDKVEFKPWPKIPRATPHKILITEKIDGTNACIVIEGGEIVAVQSRKRFITPEADNFGFAKWVEDNKEELLSLGDGYHYGEWAGEGVQKNPSGLQGKHFFLFDALRWTNSDGIPSCCSVVPILYFGELKDDIIEEVMLELQAQRTSQGVSTEGIVVLDLVTKHRTKYTYKYSQGKWKETE